MFTNKHLLEIFFFDDKIVQKNCFSTIAVYQLQLFSIQKQSLGGVQKGVFHNFSKFTGKHLYQSFFFNKAAGLRLATLLKKRL